MKIISCVIKRLTPLEGGNSSCEHYGNTLENAGTPITSVLDIPRNQMQAAHDRNSHNDGKNWGELTADERRINVLAGRKNGMSWRDIAVAVGLKRHNHSMVYRWAICNIPELKRKVRLEMMNHYPKKIRKNRAHYLPVTISKKI